jgi:hypothetical protein
LALHKKTAEWLERKDKKSIILSQAERPERVLASLGMRQQAVIGNRVYLSGATTLRPDTTHAITCKFPPEHKQPTQNTAKNKSQV